MMVIPVNRIDAHIGDRVRTRREALGISTHRLVIALSTTVEHVERMDDGAMRISAEDLMLLTQQFNVDVGYFFDDLEHDRR